MRTGRQELLHGIPIQWWLIPKPVRERGGGQFVERHQVTAVPDLINVLVHKIFLNVSWHGYFSDGISLPSGITVWQNSGGFLAAASDWLGILFNLSPHQLNNFPDSLRISRLFVRNFYFEFLFQSTDYLNVSHRVEVPEKTEIFRKII